MKSFISASGFDVSGVAHATLLRRISSALKALMKLRTSQIADFTGLSSSYISQVKHGKRRPSNRLLESLENSFKPGKPDVDYFSLFFKSREAMGVSLNTLHYYKDRLCLFVKEYDYLKASRANIEDYLKAVPPNENGLATRHASYRAIKTFYRWLNAEYDIPNPMTNIKAPILSKPILPSFSREQVLYLIEQANTVRAKAIIALLTESGLRISELANIKPEDVDWERHTIKVWGKGRKQAYAPFGRLTDKYLRESIEQYPPNGNIWGMNYEGIRTALRRLKETTGLPCNPHTFRRTFACLLRRAGVDSLMIKDLGRWESVEMVDRYTRSITFEDSLRAYRYNLI